MSNILVCGRREEGKTTLAMWLAKQRHAAVVVFDPRGMIEGDIIVYSPEQLEEEIEKLRPVTIVYRFDEGDAHVAYDEMAAILFPPRFTRGGFAVVVDEAGQIQTASSINKAHDRAIRQHPTKPVQESVTIVQTFHRMQDVHGASKSLMNELYIFRVTSPQDLRALEDHTGGDTELCEAVKKLPQHHCIRYMYSRQPEGMPDFYVWSDPSVWHTKATTQDSGPQPETQVDPEKERGVI